jgi:hypothetical protein
MPDNAQLSAAINSANQAMASGNLAQFQEAIREYNLTYANSVAQLYGNNYGPGNPAPQNASTLAAGQAVGSVGYIPGASGLTAGQTSAELSGLQSSASNAAGLTGVYANPKQSAYTPGTFLRIDPSTYDYNTYKDQLDYVLPSGQLQRVSTQQAQQMGWNGNLGAMNTIPFSTAATLESAPPTNLPQQTEASKTNYANLNTSAQNQAIAQSGVTGMYQAPATVQAPGTDLNGSTFYQLPQADQMAYYYSNGGDWGAAMNKWVTDSNAAITKYYQDRGLPVPTPGAAAPQETMAAQQQYFQQANDLATQYGQYYAPGAPGQQGVAGVNTPQVGQQTLAGNQQQYAQGTGLVSLIAGLQANPFQQQAALGQLKNLLGGQNVAGFANTGTAAGAGTGGVGYLQQMLDDIKSGGASNQTTTDDVLGAIPTPTKLDSVNFFKAPTSTQNLVLTGMQQKYGLDPSDSLNMIKNTLPGFQAPATYGTVKRAA